MASTGIDKKLPGVLYTKNETILWNDIPEFYPEQMYKECEMIEKLRKESHYIVPLGVTKSEMIAHEILKDIAGIDSNNLHELTTKIVFGSMKGPTTTAGYRMTIKPSPMYFFANVDDIRRKVQTIDKLDENIREYVYKCPNSEARIRIVYGIYDVILIDDKLLDYAVTEIAKRYDDMMCRRYFNMSAVDFRILNDRISRLGGRIELNDSFAFANVAGPLVTIQLPYDKLDRLKIENEFVFEHMRRNYIPAVSKIVTHNDRVTIVYFMDGTFTKCVCGKDEEFNLYVGVAFCLFKKMLSRGGEDGHKAFNDMMRKALKTIEDEEKLQKMIKQAKHEERLREAKRLEKKRMKAFKKKEEQIGIMQEALRRDREAANEEE